MSACRSPPSSAFADTAAPGPVRLLRGCLALGVLLAACACGVRPAATQDPACHIRVIVSFNAPQDSPPDARFVMDVARAAAVQLTFLHSIGPGLDLYALSTPERDPSCRDALARLRHERRVRFADVDQRRRVQG